jgi:Rv0078B-related antitoxin
MRLTFDLCLVAEAMKRQSLRRRHPGLRAEEIEKLMDEWRLTRPGAEDGDGPGRPAPWRLEQWRSALLKAR